MGELEKQQLSKHLARGWWFFFLLVGSFPGEYLKSNYLLHNEWLFGFFWHLPVTNALKQLNFNLQKTSLLAFHLVKLFL